MNSELLPCPFCGGEARFEIDTDGSFMLEVEHEPWCFLTSMDTRHWYYCETVEEAAQDWNQRAEPAYTAGYKDGYQIGKSEVRTCKPEKEYSEPCDGLSLVRTKCSLCGETMYGYERFCAGCGARVVGD